ncbi:MAG TPA: NUDIX domain-containing protein [bacterium]|nr:NUDIX domain-containing protein [bacterium]
MDYENSKFIIASGPVIIENGKVLLNRHGETEADQRFWKFVGGRVELADVEIDGDALEIACKREVKEEMGLDIEIIIPIKPMLIKHPDKPNAYIILIHYLAKRLNEIMPGPDIIEYGWFDIDSLPENCAPNISQVIVAYKEVWKRLK